MSPEQARGLDLDARTGLFSFRAVFYGMTTSRRAFPGSTSAVVFTAILTQNASPATRAQSPPDSTKSWLRRLRKIATFDINTLRILARM